MFQTEILREQFQETVKLCSLILSLKDVYLKIRYCGYDNRKMIGKREQKEKTKRTRKTTKEKEKTDFN